MKTLIQYILGLMLALAGPGLPAQDTAFTYQGRMASAGGDANGSFDLTFTLFTTNSGGFPVASITNSATTVSNGLFLATLNFGPGVFNGTNYWLELGVRTHGGGSFTSLGPRQPVSPSPYAIFASTASLAGNVSGSVNAAQLSGTVANNQLAHNAITVTAGSGLGGGGAVALGGSVTLNNTGISAVTGNADITAATTGGVVTLGTTASAANTAGTIVRRDANGNFTATTLTLNGQLNLANLENNTAVGASVLLNNTTGTSNTASGFQALYHNSSGNNNLALGTLAGFNITTGSSNIEIGNPGMATDANLTRIGSGQSQTYLAGALAVNGTTVVDGSGHWVGSPTGLAGPQGPAGPTGQNGAAGPQGSQGVAGPLGPAGATGATGPQGLQGFPGATGPAGPAGTNGNTVWHGTGAPPSSLGTNGDFYINTLVDSLYGPKTDSTWGGGVSLVGPQGPAGPAGPTGPGSTLASLGVKTGSVTGSVSAQGVANLTVTFTTPFANANYAILLAPKVYSYNSTPISVNACYNSKSASGFTANLVTDLLVSSPPAITCDWTAIPYNNP